MAALPICFNEELEVVVTQFVDDHIEILYAEEYHGPDYNEMLSLVYGLMSKYNVDSVYVDGANPSFIKSQAADR